MTQADSIFGAEPDRVKRLLEVGAEVRDVVPEEDVPSAASVGALMEKSGTRIGRYKLIRVLGEGGMGIVYLAQQTEPVKREVALKVIKPGMDSKRVIARFEAEQQALALMEHPHVARVHDAGLTQSGRPYFVMEHVKGSPITEYCDKNKMTIEERLRLFLHVCEAIQYAHQKGIIHRDIKPSNILVNIEDGEAAPKVIDFGVARAISQPLTNRTFHTEQGQLIGTPEYMSPEQVDLCNKDIDTRTDVYSLGVLLYELLTGVLPFDRETFREKGIDHIRKVICEQDPATPSTRLGKTSMPELTESARKRRADVRTLIRKLHSDLDWITLKALEKEPARRYATVEALAKDLRRHLDHLPVSAAPPGVVYQSQKFLRRHRRQVLATIMVLIVCLAVVIAAVMSTRASKESAQVEALQHGQLLDQARELFGTRKYKEALATVSKILQSPYVGRQANLLHAQLLLEEQGAGSAVPVLERLLSTPDAVAGQAHFLLANIYYEGDPCAPGETSEFYQKWQEHREQAEQLIAGTAQYYFLRAKAAYGVREMLEMLGKALELDKQHYDSLRERALIYYSQHDYEKMARDAARMIGIRPDNPHGYALSAMAMQALGRLDEAIKDHNDAIQLAPEDPELYDSRRQTYTCLGQLVPALRDAEKCTELRPRDTSYRHKLFAAYTALGRYDEAQREYEYFLSYPFLREHRVGGPPTYLRGFFYLISAKLVAESLAENRPWHGPRAPPNRPPFAWMNEIDAYYRNLQSHGRRLVSRGFHPSWSPDGTRLAYSHGLLSASGVAVFDTETGKTELLVTSGKNPAWSPDGRFIAFERNRRIWSPENLAAFGIRTLRWQPGVQPTTHSEEIWIIDMETHEIQRVGEGTCPHWGHQSGRLYYTGGPRNTLYAVSPAYIDTGPIEILPDCAGWAPVISPNERYIADPATRELRIIDAASREVIATWIAPSSPLGGLIVSWSPDSSELSIGGSIGSEMGLWIYDVETGDALKVQDGGWMTSAWAPDRSKMALTLGLMLEIWQVDLKPAVPTMASFENVQTTDAYCLDLMARLNQRIAIDPPFVHWHYLRVDCALWTGHPKADDYLHLLEQTLPPYNAADCAHEARWMLEATPELRDKLLPLALLLTRKAVEKEPENVDFLRTLGEALYHTKDRDNAEDILLKTFELNIINSDLQDPKTVKIIHSLIQLYEAWNKPEQVEKWRTKLSQTETIK
jgi:serine/threonine protein kinase/tetratricopeptide (TPR) repeat protein